MDMLFTGMMFIIFSSQNEKIPFHFFRSGANEKSQMEYEIGARVHLEFQSVARRFQENERR